jgi:murein DD-endopeptidase MepM/ murein hydrolase activator NlpD
MRSRGLLVLLCALIFVVTPAAAQTDNITEAEAKADAAAQRVGDARVKADAASSAFLAAESQLEQVNDQLEALAAVVEQKRVELLALKEDLKDFAIYRYTSGGTEESASMFSADNVNDAVTKEALATMVGDRKVDVIDKVKNAQAEFTAESAKLATQQKQAKALTDDLAKKNDVVTSELQALQTELDGLNSVVSGLKEAERVRIREAALAKARDAARVAEEARQRKAAEDAAKKKDAPPPTEAPARPKVTGPFECPVPGASFSDSWGQARSGGRGHKGVDMIAPAGTPTYAPVPGDITFGTDSLGGRSWYLYGDDGNFYYGTHLSRFGPREGHVSAGELVGYVGMTGNASINHLHFEIHIGGRGNQVNPYPTVAQYC